VLKTLTGLQRVLLFALALLPLLIVLLLISPALIIRSFLPGGQCWVVELLKAVAAYIKPILAGSADPQRPPIPKGP
jgi:hypothetical protein